MKLLNTDQDKETRVNQKSNSYQIIRLFTSSDKLLHLGLIGVVHTFIGMLVTGLGRI